MRCASSRTSQICVAIRHRSRLAQETISNVAVAGKLRLDDFHRDRTLESQVSSAIDSSHPAGADFTLYPEPAGYKLGDIHI